MDQQNGLGLSWPRQREKTRWPRQGLKTFHHGETGSEDEEQRIGIYRSESRRAWCPRGKRRKAGATAPTRAMGPEVGGQGSWMEVTAEADDEEAKEREGGIKVNSPLMHKVLLTSTRATAETSSRSQWFHTCFACLSFLGTSLCRLGSPPRKTRPSRAECSSPSLPHTMTTGHRLPGLQAAAGLKGPHTSLHPRQAPRAGPRLPGCTCAESPARSRAPQVRLPLELRHGRSTLVGWALFQDPPGHLASLASCGCSLSPHKAGGIK